MRVMLVLLAIIFSGPLIATECKIASVCNSDSALEQDIGFTTRKIQSLELELAERKNWLRMQKFMKRERDNEARKRAKEQRLRQNRLQKCDKIKGQIRLVDSRLKSTHSQLQGENLNAKLREYRATELRVCNNE